MSILQNKIDFIVLVAVKNANPKVKSKFVCKFL